MYFGSFEITRNIVYDNGVNGILLHNITTNFTEFLVEFNLFSNFANLASNLTNLHSKVLVENNLVFNNGKTSKTNEYRKSADGISLSFGEKNFNQTATVKNNHVHVTELPGTTYSC